MKAKIVVSAYKMACVVGVHPHEQTTAQDIFLDLEVDVRFEEDAIASTVDYDALVQRCEKVASTGKFQLLEMLAQKILEALFADFPILRAKVRVSKPRALAKAKNVSVEVER
jgi:dihydroneopterin aldolase